MEINKPDARAGTTVLIIEDEADILNFIARVAELEGHHVITADDGSAGLDILRRQPVGLVVLDLRLPGVDGWSVLRDIRQDPNFGDIPVIVLTAIAAPVQRARTLRMGASKYLVKPLSAAALSTAIGSALAGTPQVSGAVR